MPVLKSWYLNNVEFLEGGLEILDIGKVGCHFGVSTLVSTKELVDYHLGVKSDV